MDWEAGGVSGWRAGSWLRTGGSRFPVGGRGGGIALGPPSLSFPAPRCRKAQLRALALSSALTLTSYVFKSPDPSWPLPSPETWESWTRCLLRTLLALTGRIHTELPANACSTHLCIHLTTKAGQPPRGSEKYLKRADKPGYNKSLRGNAYPYIQNWRHPKRESDPVSQSVTRTGTWKGHQSLGRNNFFFFLSCEGFTAYFVTCTWRKEMPLNI